MPLGARFYLNLKDTFVALSIRRNLVLVSLLDKFGYSCSFGNNQFYLSLNSNIVGISFLKAYNNLYMLETLASYNETLNEKSQSLDVFKTFKVEVENKLNKRIKKL